MSQLAGAGVRRFSKDIKDWGEYVKIAKLKPQG